MGMGCDGCGARRAVSRRRLLQVGGAAGAAGLLGGCDELPVRVVSEAQVRELGLETWQRMRERQAPSRDAALQRAGTRQTATLLEAAGEDPGQWEVVVFASDEANAFVVPGGRMGIYEGMVRVAGNRERLAAVIGHEIGHHQADHAVERVNTAVLTNAGLQLVRIALQLGDVAFAEEIAAAVGVGAEYGILLPYSRAHELEADRLGMVTMAKAGYDPEAAIGLWQRMAEMGGERPPTFLSTHPSPDDRMEALRRYLDEARAAA